MAHGGLNTQEVHGVLLVVAAVIVHIPVAGIINSFGVFVQQLNREFCPFDCLQLLGWIGALTFGLNRAFCWLVVELEAIISPYILFLLGVGMCGASLFLASFVEQLQWLLLFYCLIYGFGSSLTMNTPYVLIEEIFPPSHRFHVTATSIMNVGAPVGMLLVNPLVAYLDGIEGHTWRNTLRIFGVVVLITGFLCSFPMSRYPRVVICWRKCFSKDGAALSHGYKDMDKKDDGQLTDQDDQQSKDKAENTQTENTNPKDVVRELDKGHKSNSLVFLCAENTITNLLCWAVGMFLLSVAIFIPKVHFIQYMHDLSIDAETAASCMSYEGLAEALLSFLISVLGSPIAPHFIWMFALCSGILSIGSALLPYSTRVIQIAVYCTIHGAVDGLLMTTIYPTLQLFVTGVKAKQALWSLTLLVIGAGQVVGLPMAGLVYDETNSYELVFLIASGVFGCASIAFLFIACRQASGDVTEDEITVEQPISSTNTQDEKSVLRNASLKKYKSIKESEKSKSQSMENDPKPDGVKD